MDTIIRVRRHAITVIIVCIVVTYFEAYIGRIKSYDCRMSAPAVNYGHKSRGITSGDVAQAADSLLRSRERPTVERIRARLGSGSPNTIGPMLDEWWGRLAGRLDNGPAAFHRLPESVAHIAEALWLQALEEGRIRAQQELSADTRTAQDQRHAYELRSHVLSLREGEFESRLMDRNKVIALLERQLKEIKLLLGKERAGREAAEGRVGVLRNVRVTRQRPLASRKAVLKRAAASVRARKAPNKAMGTRKSAKRPRQHLRSPQLRAVS